MRWSLRENEQWFGVLLLVALILGCLVVLLIALFEKPRSGGKMRYRKKPIIVEAEQWFVGVLLPYVQYDKGGHFVVTMHAGQKVYLQEGDYVIPEPDGVHHYPVKASVFEQTFERVE